MFNKSLILALAAASTSVVAQTFTDCDPREKSCPPAPALGKTVEIDFTKSKGEEYLHTLAGTKVEYDSEKGAIFSIANEKQAPTKASDDYIFFGELHCDVQAAAGQGIVTSIVLQSDDLDEIDWEWVGGDNAQVQTNYFGKGDDGTYDRGGYHAVTNPTGQFHRYGIIWTQDKIDWTIDGNVIRTLTYQDAKGGTKYPQSPMQIKIGTWTAGRSDAAPGTIEWAGGKADFTKGPFIGYYKNCKIVDYMGGKSAATEYAYPEGYDGMWQNVIINNDPNKSDDETTTTKTTTKAPSTTKTSAAETTTEESTTTESSSADATSSAEESASTEESNVSGADRTSGSSPSASTDNSTEESEAPSSGMMTKANLALGAAGLFAAFFL